jgi:hypothetical protein
MEHTSSTIALVKDFVAVARRQQQAVSVQSVQCAAELERVAVLSSGWLYSLLLPATVAFMNSSAAAAAIPAGIAWCI